MYPGKIGPDVQKEAWMKGRTGRSLLRHLQGRAGRNEKGEVGGAGEEFSKSTEGEGYNRRKGFLETSPGEQLGRQGGCKQRIKNQIRVDRLGGRRGGERRGGTFDRLVKSGEGGSRRNRTSAGEINSKDLRKRLLIENGLCGRSVGKGGGGLQI